MFENLHENIKLIDEKGRFKKRHRGLFSAIG